MSDNSIYYASQPFLPIGNRAGQVPAAPAGNGAAKKAASSFKDILSAKLDAVQFSQHARNRMAERGIFLSNGEMEKLNATVQKMAQKGARESLVYMKNTAFVVSVKNRTVITAMDGASAKDNIFTNIDSAVIL